MTRTTPPTPATSGWWGRWAAARAASCSGSTGGSRTGRQGRPGRWSRAPAPATWPASVARAATWPGTARPRSPTSWAGHWPDRDAGWVSWPVAMAKPILPERRRRRGTIRPGGPDWVYLPVEVPAGVGELAVRYRYDRPATPSGVPGNALDLGVFDAAGFRGGSGGARDGFAVGEAAATPGYLPGPVDAGTWQVVLGPYTVAPQGLRWEVEVTLGAGPPGPGCVPGPAPARAAGRGRAWYRGDLHTHTVHSDGRRTLAGLAADARAAGLDFIASTEHNTPSASLGWGGHAGPDLLVIDGQEVTSRDGHWLALGQPPGAVVDWRYRAADGVLDGVLAALHGQDGLAVPAHPFDPCPGC